jgi:replicative DNA helicase
MTPNVPQGVRANLEAEECVIGLALSNRTVLPNLVADLQPEDFYRPGFGRVFAIIIDLFNEGMGVDAVTVSDQLHAQGKLDELGGRAGLLELSINVPSAASAGTYAQIIRREASARRLDTAAGEAREALANHGDPVEIADALEERVRTLDRGGRLPERYWRNWDEYRVADHEGVGVPLIDGICYQHTRTILIAPEKLGKSMLARQIAFCAAAGIHPFTFHRMEPVRVLVVDAENDDEELLPTSVTLIDLLNKTEDAQPLRPALLSAPYGMDLRSRRDRGELEEVLEDLRPQLIIGGPIYKMLPQGDNTSDPRHAEQLQRILDNVRKRWGCALMLEHHAPAGRAGEARELRSVGGQRWAAWPEVTVALHTRKGDEGKPDGADVKFPHPPRGRFKWPKRFDRGTQPDDWPWMPVWRRFSDAPPPPGTPPIITQHFYEPTTRDDPF